MAKTVEAHRDALLTAARMLSAFSDMSHAVEVVEHSGARKLALFDCEPAARYYAEGCVEASERRQGPGRAYLYRVRDLAKDTVKDVNKRPEWLAPGA